MPITRPRTPAQILRALVDPLVDEQGTPLTGEALARAERRREHWQTQLPDTLRGNIRQVCNRVELEDAAPLMDELAAAIERTEIPHKDLRPGFAFSFTDMERLLCAYYYGGGKSWLSNLHRQDMNDKLQLDKAILYNAEQREHGNPLLKQFTHRQVDHAIRELAQRKTVRAGMARAGWLEYCLRVQCRKADPTHPENAEWPEVRPMDKIRAMLVLSQILAPLLGHIDRRQDSISARLETLFNQLKK